MPKLKQFAQCRIAMYPRDHRPAHVHVEFNDGDRCTVEIASLKVVGTIRPKARLTEPLAWISRHRERLLMMWQEIVQ